MSKVLSSLTRFLSGLLFLTSLTLSAAASAQNAPAEGKDYRALRPAQATDAGAGKIEVIEFFWYGCPHCNAFEPVLNDWIKKQGADVVVRRVPVAFNASLVPHQRLYYALDALGKETELRAKVFAALHVEHNPMNKEEVMADWAAKNGIDRKKFLDAYNSFTVQTKTARAAQMADAYGVDGVPMMAVNGKFTVPNSGNTLRIVDYLVARERMAGGKK